MTDATGLSARRRRIQRALARRAATDSGACMCAKFANGSYRSVHNWGQPGCQYEELVIAQAS